ncbi:uncharacterized protein LOC105255522 isoform X1 [Camponotus floridanus]|uniref:uncharacterized protein LOC105255522 isoform X1 n=1 Tax=Camponotus floridanus TaxID=104421 RepID=UPI000DC6AC6A|nr:uncharacterized protein LOC105255522 isoform X1 [Camponotus floridanus]XP_025270690.1 uncharacterized protein LOC105255522 isoform X1 [Camponotus floridanus]
MYFVVFCHDWCATVPACWLNLKIHKVQWPPKTSNPTMESKKATNPKDNWAVIKYTRVLGPYSNYETARAVEIAAVDLSTNDDEEPLQNITNQSDQLPQKRLRKKPAHLISSDEEDADNESETITTKIKKNVPKPTFAYNVDHKEQKNLVESKAKGPTNASKCQKVKNIEDENIYLEPDNNNNHKDDELLEDTELLDYGNYFADPVQSEKAIDLKKVKPVNKCDKNLNSDSVYFQPRKDVKIIHSIKTNIPIRVVSQEKPESSHVSSVVKQKTTAATVKDPSSTKCHTHCCSACRLNIERILHKLEALSMFLMDSNHINENPQNANALPQFPIQNIESLKAFNKLLDDDAGARNQYKKMIQIRGGRDVKKHIRQILITILNDDLACKLSWTGQKKRSESKT